MINDLLVAPLIAAFMAVAVTTTIELWKGRGRRRLYGRWLSAVQPVFYQTEKWHRQSVDIRPSLFGIVLRTASEPEKLQWELHATLHEKVFLVGRWRSLRPGSISNGYMTVQISSNGKYMCGHDYADLRSNENSAYGTILFARSEGDLQKAWAAVASGSRTILALTETVDFPETTLATQEDGAKKHPIA